jgi:endoglucanase
MKKITISICLLGVAAFLVVFIPACKENQSPAPKPASQMPSLHTEGRWIVNSEGDTLILRGVNIPSLEWNARGDNMIQSLMQAIDVWGCDFLRIPLSQDRWFGHTSEQADGGLTYRKLVADLVALAQTRKAYLWLDLHWSNGNQWGSYIGQHVMPDSNSLIFWQDLAGKYKNHPVVLFGLYNEPYNISWDIWRNGGELTEYYNRNNEDTYLTYYAVGHQQLYDEIRALGANNIIIAAGLDWGFDLRGILNGYALEGENIAYDTHPYPWKTSDWPEYWADVGELHPVIVGEWGGGDSDMLYFSRITQFMRYHKFCWCAWCFHPSAGPQLLQDWQYNPTTFGQIVMRELAEPVVVGE